MTTFPPMRSATNRQQHILIHKQAVLVHVILLDELSELVRFLCIVQRIHVHDLISRPSHVSNKFTNIKTVVLTWAGPGKFPFSLAPGS
jgi:hypothetical protein